MLKLDLDGNLAGKRISQREQKRLNKEICALHKRIEELEA
ncbi:unnamed protein product [Larinioides sclopetarius]|uniref:Uncharacterized protein n=1 Tax=Larinioides sclopetarius TaxID=280406 RepID=A0AAV1ZTW5_9ARAC